jgi:uncharacterized protein RhaS with RHS repeats
MMSVFSHTPSATVLDNRGLSVRDIAYHRHPDTPNVTRERIARHRYDARGFLTQSADPRLHAAGRAFIAVSNICTAGARVLQDLRYGYDPVGNVLRVRNDAEETRFWRNQKVVPKTLTPTQLTSCNASLVSCAVIRNVTGPLLIRAAGVKILSSGGATITATGIPLIISN